MAKVNKMVSLDMENYEKLGKEKNASKLINDLLTNHYLNFGDKEKLIVKKIELREIEEKLSEKEIELNQKALQEADVQRKQTEREKIKFQNAKKLLSDHMLRPILDEEVEEYLTNKKYTNYQDYINFLNDKTLSQVQ